jgi:nitroreductase
METIEAIKSRRSIRKYKAEQVPEEKISDILACAMQAPSAGNEQPWHFLVIKDKKTLAKIPQINPYAAMAKDAPLAILVLGDTTLEKFNGFWVQDCSAAVQNILLAAHGLGLGAVWTAIYGLDDRVKGFKDLFSLPDNILPLALIPIGFPENDIAPVDRFNEERVHLDKW